MEPGAPEYNPAQDTTTIAYDGLTYACYAVSSAPATTDTAPTTTSPPPAPPTECSNGLDDNGDGLTDAADWGCQHGDSEETRPDPNRLVRCSGTARGGFFTDLTERRTTCARARRVMKQWIKSSGFGTRRGAKRTTRVSIYRCRLAVIQADENPYGRVICTSKSGKFVRFYGFS